MQVSITVWVSHTHESKIEYMHVGEYYCMGVWEYKQCTCMWVSITVSVCESKIEYMHVGEYYCMGVWEYR